MKQGVPDGEGARGERGGGSKLGQGSGEGKGRQTSDGESVSGTFCSLPASFPRVPNNSMHIPPCFRSSVDLPILTRLFQSASQYLVRLVQPAPSDLSVGNFSCAFSLRLPFRSLVPNFIRTFCPQVSFRSSVSPIQSHFQACQFPSRFVGGRGFIFQASVPKSSRVGRNRQEGVRIAQNRLRHRWERPRTCQNHPGMGGIVQSRPRAMLDSLPLSDRSAVHWAGRSALFPQEGDV